MLRLVPPLSRALELFVYVRRCVLQSFGCSYSYEYIEEERWRTGEVGLPRGFTIDEE